MWEAGLILGLGRSPGERNGNPFQYSCLENSMDRGAWQATYSPCGRKESDMTEQLTLSFHFHYYFHFLWIKDLSRAQLSPVVPGVSQAAVISRPDWEGSTFQVTHMVVVKFQISQAVKLKLLSSSHTQGLRLSLVPCYVGLSMQHLRTWQVASLEWPRKTEREYTNRMEATAFSSSLRSDIPSLLPCSVHQNQILGSSPHQQGGDYTMV